VQSNFCPQLRGSTKTVGYCSWWQRFIMVHLPNFLSKINRIIFHYYCVIIAKILNSCDESDCCESSPSCRSSDCSIALHLIRLHNILGFYILTRLKSVRSYLIFLISAIFERCLVLLKQPSLIKGLTCFHWWPKTTARSFRCSRNWYNG